MDTNLPEENKAENNEVKVIINNKKRFNFLALVILAVSVLAIGLALYLYYPKTTTKNVANVEEPSTLEYDVIRKVLLTPLSADKAGVNLDSGFKLESEVPLTPKQIQSSLTINSSRDYELKKINDKEYNVLVGQLDANKVYKFDMASNDPNLKYSWAFQTKKPFKILRTLPRDKAVGVPVDTGIEFTTSYENLADLENHFTIEPKVEGRFEQHNKTITFVPKEKLKYGMIYKVIIKAGLGIQDSSDKLDAGYEFQFQTVLNPPNNDYKYWSIEYEQNIFNTKTKPIFKVYGDTETLKNGVNVEVYKFDNKDSFLKSLDSENDSIKPDWAISYNQNDKDHDLSNLEKVLSINVKPTKVSNDYWINSAIEFPKELKEGYYIIKFKAQTKDIWQHIQINDLATYVNINEKNSLVWVNDTNTNTPVEDATVESKYFNSSIKTNKDGIAEYKSKIDYEKNYGKIRFTVSAKDKMPLIIDAFYNGNNSTEDYNRYNYQAQFKKYFSCLYIDKTVYLPSETVRFWGILQPRDSGAMPKKASLRLSKTTIDENTYLEKFTQISMTEIDIGDSGTFTGDIPLNNISEENYYLDLLVDNQIIATQSLKIGKYEKPSYQLQITTDKKYAFVGDKVNFDINASFYGGSPASGLKFNYDIKYDYPSKTIKQGTIVTDKQGKGAISETFETLDKMSSKPIYVTFHASNSNTEEKEISNSTTVQIFTRDILLKQSSTFEGNTCKLKVETNKVELPKKGDANYSNIDDFKGAPVDIPINAVITECFDVKQVKSEKYDYINKKTIYEYEYIPVENKLKEIDFITQKGEYSFEIPVNYDENSGKHYKIIYNAVDSKGRKIQEVQTIYPRSGNKSGADLIGDVYYLNTNLPKDNREVKIGDKIQYSLWTNDKQVKEGSGNRALYMTFKNGMIQYKMAEDLKYDIEFKKENIPNLYIKAIYFDKGFLYETDEDILSYNEKEKQIKVDVKPDKDNYKPGETVEAAFKVTNQRGEPISSEILVSVVDASAFKENQQYVDVLSSLYGFYDPKSINASQLTHKKLVFDYHGGHGGGWGGKYTSPGIDKNDNTYFGSIKTNSSGTGKVSFKLPDKPGAYRVTYIAVNKEVGAANGNFEINSKSPFFVDLITPSIFLSSDKPNIQVRVFGDEVNQGEDVAYTFTVESPQGEKKEIKVNGKVGEVKGIPYEMTNTGKYTITAKADYKKVTDTKTAAVNVVDNILEVSKVKYYNLENDLKIEGSNNNELFFYLRDGSKFYEELNSLASQWGERVDQKLSRLVAKGLYKKYYNDDRYDDLSEKALLSYQQKDGGISLLTYGSTEPQLSAKITSVAKSYFDNAALSQYFYGILEDKKASPEDVAAAYWGLASLGEPILLDVQKLLEDNLFDLKSKTYLALACSELGDFTTSMKYLNDMIAQNGKRQNEEMYIDMGKNRDDLMEYTALHTMLALKVRHEDSSILHEYIRKNNSKEMLFYIEKLAYLTNVMPKTTTKGSFKYLLDGKETIVNLEKAKTYKVNVTQDKLKDFKISDVSGDITLAVRYPGPITDMDNKKSDKLNITRVYQVNGKETKTFKQSDTVRVVLHIDFAKGVSKGQYEITDVLPAGFKVINRYDMYKAGEWSPSDISDQKVSFNYYYNPASGNGSKDLVYYARAVVPGEFNIDNCAIRQYESMETGFTNKDVIKIEALTTN